MPRPAVRCYSSSTTCTGWTRARCGCWAPYGLLSFVKAVGVGRTVISSDSGQKNNPLPVTLYRRAVRGLLGAGLAESDIRQLVGTNAGQLLYA